MTRGRLWFGALLALVGAVSVANAQDAVKIDPDNPKYLLFRGKPLVLISASPPRTPALASRRR